MGERPTGTVTFLFSDVEGSTRRWDADPEGMRVELAAHDEVLRAAVESHGGWLFKHTGDDEVHKTSLGRRLLRDTNRGEPDLSVPDSDLIVRWTRRSRMADDERPPVWVGHIVVNATDRAEATRFYLDLGMREIEINDQVSVLELRGGTHLVVVGGDPAADAPFDLMVDDIDGAHEKWAELGMEPSSIERGRIHDKFFLTDPSGTRITINSSHVVGTV
jgi:hypothetical protein